MKKKTAPAGYSPREKAVLAAIRAANGKRVTTTDLIDTVFGKEAPFNARQSLLSTMSHLSRKMVSREEKFALKKSTRRGPRPVSFWLEERA